MASFVGILFLLVLGGWSVDALRVHPADARGFLEIENSLSTVGARVMSKLMSMNGVDNATAFSIVKAMTPNVAEGQCDHFDTSYSRGGGAYYAWCEKAINKVMAQKDIMPKGLSYGVFDTDTWAEGMSNKYHVPTELFDCYHTSKNTELINAHSFKIPFSRHDVCVGSKAHTDADGREFETMAMHLEGRKPLSTFVKLDVEGSEWEVMEDLVKNKKELSKIATLDFELHFCMMEKGHDLLSILEGLSDTFAITDVWDGHKDHKILPERSSCKPTAMVSISYVNKKLL